jgi:hypothetical protein
VHSIDYATYAQAEAELAWLNAQVTITQSNASTSGGSVDWLREFMSELSNRCAHRGLWIGHVKAYVATPTGGSKASVLRAGEAPTFDLGDARPLVEARLLVNARVRGRPDYRRR